MKNFEQIYSEYYDVVFYYSLSLCSDEQLAEEITQETFFKALKSINSYRGECKLNVWLCQVAKNTYLTFAKRRQRQADFPDEDIPSEEEYNHYEDNLTVERDAAKIIVTEQVTSGIIDLKIVEEGGQTYEYTITDTLEETIEIAKKHSENWTIIVDFSRIPKGITRSRYIVKAVLLTSIPF